MIDFLQNAASVLVFAALALGIAYGLERFRRRALRTWANEQGGTFEPGAVEVPEAAGFDGSGGGDIPPYSHVVRVSTPEATYVLARHYHSWRDVRNDRKSSSQVFCFIRRPGAAWPAVDVQRSVKGFAAGLLGRPEPVSLAVPGAAPDFAAAFQVVGEGSPEALARLLPPAVQRELLASETLIAGLRTHGDVTRLQAVGQLAGGYPHRKIYAIARRLVAAWT